MNSLLPICAVVALIVSAIPVESVGLHRPDRSLWGYEEANGPAVWHTLKDDYAVCASGTRQSPIDIVYVPTNEECDPIVFSESYEADLVGTFKDNGHTVQFTAAVPNTYTMTGGPFGTEVYNFLQLHFHWGSVNTQGSEHTMRGKKYPMEMHMVHVNSKYVNADGTLDPLYATNDDGLAVVGFMFKIDPRKDFAPMNTFTGAITDLAGAVDTSVDMTFNLNQFTKHVSRGYYTYLGSLTTPGCNEVVTWVNAKKFLKISQTQLDVFRETHMDNFRPPQPLNDRPIGKGLSEYAIQFKCPSE